MLHLQTSIEHTRIQPGIIYPTLPLPLNSLVGRQDLITQICDVLSREENRLVTIAGEAGVGKTRVAKEALARLRGKDGREHLYITLPDDAGGKDVAPIALTSLATLVESAPTTLAELAEALADRRVLLTLNAIDRAVTGATSLIELLQHLPTVNILLTSRIELHVRGERIIVVPPLTLPAPESSLAEAQATESVQLLVDRIQGYDPTFELTNENLDDVIAICRHLEGLPLSLELIAGRVRLFSVATIRAKLPNALDLLADGSTDLPDRNRSIRSAISWTYSALPKAQQRALRSLCIFAQSISLPMALRIQTLDPDGAPTSEAALNNLARLVSSGMVTTVPMRSGINDARYRIRWDVRAFGVEELHAHGEYERVVRNLLQSYLQLMLPRLNDVHGDEEVALYRELDEERQDLKLALMHAATDGDSIQQAMALAAALWPYWNASGALEEGQQILQTLIDAHGHEESGIYASALHALGGISIELNRDADAETLTQQAVRIRRAIDDKAGLAASLNNLGVVNMQAGQMEKAQDYYRQAMALDDGTAGDKFSIVSTCNLAELRLIANDVDEAAELFSQAFDRSRRARLRRHMVNCAGYLMIVSYRLGKDDAAEEWYAAGIEVAQKADDTLGEGRLRLIRANHLWKNHEPVDALTEAILGIRAVLESDSQRSMRHAAVLLAQIAADSGQYRFGAQCLGALGDDLESLNSMFAEMNSAVIPELQATIRKEIGGASYIRQIVVGSRLAVRTTLESGIRLLETITQDAREKHEPQHPETPLTRRELEVLACLAQGMSDKQIAEYLAISPRTSMTHMGNIMKKLKVNNRSAAASKGARLGLIGGD